MTTAKPIVSVVSGTYNRLPFLKATLESIRSEVADISHEIIFIDGGSTDGTTAWLARQRDVLTIVQHNRGMWRGKKIDRRSWGYFMNLAFRCAQGKYILMISDDCLFIPGSVKAGIERFEALTKEGHCVGAVAFYFRDWPSEQYYRFYVCFGQKMTVNHGLYLRDAIESVGWIDEESFQFYCADSDLCLRLWEAGYEVIDSRASLVEHHLHANESVRGTNRAVAERDWDAYIKKWKARYARPEFPLTVRIKLNYIDSTQTTNNFPQAWSYNFYRMFSLVKRSIRKLL